MDKAGAQELLMPSLIPQEVYKDSAFLQSLGFQVDHHQNGIFDVNKNNTSTSVNKIFADNNISSKMTQRYISENTHHNGYHDLYNEAVARSVESVEKNIASYTNYLEKQGYSTEEISSITKKEGRKQVHSLMEDLRVMNQDGIDLYYDHSSNSQKYNNSDEYMEMFENKRKIANEKNSKKCGGK